MLDRVSHNSTIDDETGRRPAGGTAPATASGSGNPNDLSLIGLGPIALSKWWREAPVTVTAGDLEGFDTVRFEAEPSRVATDIAAALAIRGPRLCTPGWPPTPDCWHRCSSASPLARASICASRRWRGDACRRFHSDHVTLRLITTYLGPGTQRAIGEDPERAIHEVATSHVAIFKGCDPDPSASSTDPRPWRARVDGAWSW